MNVNFVDHSFCFALKVVSSQSHFLFLLRSFSLPPSFFPSTIVLLQSQLSLYNQKYMRKYLKQFLVENQLVHECRKSSGLNWNIYILLLRWKCVMAVHVIFNLISYKTTIANVQSDKNWHVFDLLTEIHRKRKRACLYMLCVACCDCFK